MPRRKRTQESRTTTSVQPKLRLHPHESLQALPKLTRERLKWLSERIDMSEVAVISLAVAQLIDDWDDGPADDSGAM